MEKSYNVKVFDQDGTTFLKNLTPLLKNSPSFNSRINGGFGECILDIRSQFDDFDEGASINFMNIVDIYAVDTENPAGRRIYRGYISQYEPFIDTGDEGVKVTLLGLGSLLSLGYYKDGSNFTVSHSSDDPQTIGRAIIDHFNTVFGGSLLSYDDDSTDAVGTSVSIDYEDKKWFDAIKEAGRLTDDGWWWKIDENGTYWLKPKPSTPTHTFTIGKDIVSLRAPKDSEKVINEVYVRYDGGTYKAESTASQVTYGTGSPATGLRTKILSESDAALTAATQQGDKEVADNEDAKVKATITVNDTYDLESIKVGEICKIRNFNNASTFFGSNNLLIVGVTYLGDSCRLELEDHALDFASEIDSFVNG